jgi:uncharacterized protein HemX
MFGISFLAPVVTFFASIAAKSVPWKWIGIGLAALAIVGIIGAAALHIKHTQDDLISTQKELAVQKLATDLAKLRANQIQDQHNKQVLRAEQLEVVRKNLSEEVAGLRNEIANMDLEVDIESDKPKIAVSRLNARHSDINRMLERASRNIRGSAGADGVQAGPPAGH